MKVYSKLNRSYLMIENETVRWVPTAYRPAAFAETRFDHIENWFRNEPIFPSVAGFQVFS